MLHLGWPTKNWPHKSQNHLQNKGPTIVFWWFVGLFFWWPILRGKLSTVSAFSAFNHAWQIWKIQRARNWIDRGIMFVQNHIWLNFPFDKNQVYRVPICMGWFGTETMKPTYLFANHKCFAATLMQEFVLLCKSVDQVYLLSTETWIKIVISGNIRSKLSSARLCKDTSLTSLRPRSLPPPLKNPRRLWSKKRWCLVISLVPIDNWMWPFSSDRNSQWGYFHVASLSCETTQSLLEKPWWYWSQCDFRSENHQTVLISSVCVRFFLKIICSTSRMPR